MSLWPRITVIQLQEGMSDVVRWSWETQGNFTVRSAYAAKFAGRQTAPTIEFTWKSRALLQCRFFVWLAARDRCWTLDRLPGGDFRTKILGHYAAKRTKQWITLCYGASFRELFGRRCARRWASRSGCQLWRMSCRHES